MHLFLEQIGPCVEVCKQIEAVLVARRVQLPEAQFSTNGESIYFAHQVVRMDRKVFWGICGYAKLLPTQNVRMSAYFYVQFYKGNNHVVRLAFDPIRKVWGSDLTVKELQLLSEVLKTENVDPDRLAREIRAGNLADDQFSQELDTAQAINVTSLLAKWLSEPDDPVSLQRGSRFSRTLVG
jgi:hypothetical protein